MHLFRQKINWPAIVGQVGLLLHVPAGMAVTAFAIGLIFQEWFALIPFGVVAASSFAIGQILFWSTKGAKAGHLWDAMVIAGLGWLVCSLICSIPFIWISHIQLSSGVESEVLKVFRNTVNALFESVSGFTSTGLTMMQREGPFPHVLQWWRSMLEWVGGLGLIVFILALGHLNKGGYQLYYAEARSEKMTRNIHQTALWICGIYSIFTVIALGLFLGLSMDPWDALNHALTVVSTGGFTVSQTNFHGYSTAIQIVAMFMMLIAAISFAIHYRVIREGELSALIKDSQHRLLYVLAFGGGGLVLLLNAWNGLKGHQVEAFFEWVSALTTCGFSAMNLALFPPMVKLLLVMGMFVGGATGSTVGGLKLRRLIYLVSGVVLRVFAITTSKEKYTSKSSSEKGEGPPGVDLPHSAKSERLFTAEVLFSLWASTLFLGWFLILKWVPSGHALDALFEVTSAMSNVGLTSGIVQPEIPVCGKWIFIFLMWMGRLEIIPAIILLLTLPITFIRRSSHGK